MQTALKWAAIASFGLGGCAAANGDAGSRPVDLGRGEASAVRVGGTRILDAHVNPMVPVHMAAERGSVAVTFGQPGRRGVVARLDPSSLQLLSHEQTGRSEPPAAPSTEASHVVLGGGRILVCWTEDSADGSRHAVAQLWAANGSRLGAPVLISPPDADVFGAPNAVSVDGRHVVVTFASSTGQSFDLTAVALEDAEPSGESNQMARR